MNIWEYPIWKGYQYDNITDTEIEKVLSNYQNILLKINPNLDWEDDYYLRECLDIPDELKHAARIAKLVQVILIGNKVTPITIDTFSVDNCKNCIPNGHHRIRALQYLKYDRFPASLSGYTYLIKQLKPTTYEGKKFKQVSLPLNRNKDND